MSEKKEYVVDYDIFKTKQILVVWNAQRMSEIDWSLWKDMKDSIETIFVSDRFLPITRTFGMKLRTYPYTNTSLLESKKIDGCVNGLLKNEWKCMIEFRELLLAYLEWNESFIPIQRSLTDIFLQKMVKMKISDDKTHLFMQKILFNFSNLNTKIECMMAAERTLVLFLKIIGEVKGK